MESTHSTDFDVCTMDIMNSASSQASLRRLLSIGLHYAGTVEFHRHNMMTAADRTDCSTFKQLFEEYSDISRGYIGSCFVSDWLLRWGIAMENLRDLFKKALKINVKVTNDPVKTWLNKREKMNLGFYLTPQAKINSRWITGFDVKAKRMKLQQQQKRRISSWLWGKDFFREHKQH